MNVKNIEFLLKNENRCYPLTNNPTIIPNDLIVDLFLFTTEVSVSISSLSIRYLDQIVGQNKMTMLTAEFSDGTICEQNLYEKIGNNGIIECSREEYYGKYIYTNLYNKKQLVGTIVWGPGIVSVRNLFSDTNSTNGINGASGISSQIDINVQIDPSCIGSLGGKFLNAIEIEKNGVVERFTGDIHFVLGEGIHGTPESNNTITLSAFYEKDDCEPLRTNCIKSINNVLPDQNGDIYIYGNNIINILPDEHGVIVTTSTDAGHLCPYVFESHCDTNDTGDQGPKGEDGPPGDCIKIKMSKCCECEQCDQIERCEECEKCDICEECDECEKCDLCEVDVCSSCDICDGCDNAFDNDCQPCDTADLGCDVIKEIDDQAFDEVSIITRGCLVQEPNMQWFYRKNHWIKDGIETEPMYYIKYWDYELNESYCLLETKGNFNQHIKAGDVILYKFSNINIIKDGNTVPFIFYAINHRKLMEWTHDGKSWKDFLARDNYYFSLEKGVPGWFASNNKIDTINTRPVYSFLTPNSMSDDLFKYYCDSEGKPILIYSTYSAIEPGAVSPSKKVYVVWDEDNTRAEMVTPNYLAEAQMPLCRIMNLTQRKQTTPFSVHLENCEMGSQRIDNLIGWDGVNNGTYDYYEYVSTMLRTEVFALKCLDMTGTEIWCDDPAFGTCKITSSSPIIGPHKSVTTANGKVDMYSSMRWLYWSQMDSNTDYCDGCDSNDETDIANYYENLG